MAKPISNEKRADIIRHMEAGESRADIPTDIRTLSKLTGTDSTEFEMLFPAIERFFIRSDNGDLMCSPLILENVKELKRNSIKGTLAAKHRYQQV